MPENIERRQQLRRRQAVLSALCSGGWILFSAGAVLLLRQTFYPQSRLLVALAALNAAMLIPLAVSLRNRLKEIQGGEEDEASQY